MTNKVAQSLAAYLDRRAGLLLLLGFSAGVPILLIFSTLSFWLNEAGINIKTVTQFSWAALGYSFKFIWSPLIDSLSLPFLTRSLGKRRAWLVLSQSLIMLAIVLMANINPQNESSLHLMALAAVLLGFSSATQDVVIDAYRIELAPDNPALQTVLSSTYAAGYRLGMIVAGAGSLWLASWFGSTEQQYVYAAWQQTYWTMAAVMSVGLLATWLAHEPEQHRQPAPINALDNARLFAVFLLSVCALIGVYRASSDWFPSVKNAPLTAFALESGHLLLAIAGALGAGCFLVKLGVASQQKVYQTWVTPVADFFQRYGKRALLLLALIGLYRISDIVAGVISNIFYVHLGFDKEQIAAAVKTFGVLMSLLGGFAGGVLAQKIRIMHMMMLGAILAASTNLLFMWLALHEKNTAWLYIAVGLDNLAGGLATTVFVVFLSSLTNIRFTAVQYALLSSLMTLSPKILGGYSGAIVQEIGYPQFFLFTTLIGLPILLLIWLVDKQLFRRSGS